MSAGFWAVRSVRRGRECESPTNALSSAREGRPQRLQVDVRTLRPDPSGRAAAQSAGRPGCGKASSSRPPGRSEGGGSGAELAAENGVAPGQPGRAAPHGAGPGAPPAAATG